MPINIEKMPFANLLVYVLAGILIWLIFYIFSHYVIPLLRGKRIIVNEYWKRLEIVSWLIFSAICFAAMFRVNMILTGVFAVIVLGLGWSYWRNVFSGILIKLNNQIREGDVIATDFANGELICINLSQSELLNDKGELVIIPNYKLRSSVLKHQYQQSNVKTYSFKVELTGQSSSDDVYQLALDCPYISANQEILVERITQNQFMVQTSLIDNSFVEKVKDYFDRSELV